MTTDPVELPIACSLQPAELSDRRAVWERLCERALRERRPAASGMQLVFAAREGVEEELRELARLEARCCSFAEWRVRRCGEEVVLDVRASGDGVAAVRSMLERP